MKIEELVDRLLRALDLGEYDIAADVLEQLEQQREADQPEEEALIA